MKTQVILVLAARLVLFLTHLAISRRTSVSTYQVGGIIQRENRSDDKLDDIACGSICMKCMNGVTLRVQRDMSDEETAIFITKQLAINIAESFMGLPGAPFQAWLEFAVQTGFEAVVDLTEEQFREMLDLKNDCSEIRVIGHDINSAYKADGFGSYIFHKNSKDSHHYNPEVDNAAVLLRKGIAELVDKEREAQGMSGVNRTKAWLIDATKAYLDLPSSILATLHGYPQFCGGQRGGLASIADKTGTKFPLAYSEGARQAVASKYSPNGPGSGDNRQFGQLMSECETGLREIRRMKHAVFHHA